MTIQLSSVNFKIYTMRQFSVYKSDKKKINDNMYTNNILILNFPKK